ncbi:MAG TPA: CDP-alcohol phosphatidyltransferase family protein [Chitinophagales bacterium]|nr:CDP-alcohol phosphatidyltransferase family protein [Chitinophagales bacterium]HMW12553.1 CDP-alcohol phosphatidyltransferase family protein [Chitinophagales bacterium]HMX59817.1 CDP-alcohol phosphatidyltransferase family protein [Chitinophagales bacterium]HMY23209.1 CDP-alcohol phosphatidyltransferase family protein [Chitinophagales bacterium]HMZ33496.1 CDP-alcohol phosphatidyltransferase family protein [Chitinophagales bacterium]
MVKHIPNSLTLLNLFSGCCGIVACLQQEYTLVPIFLSISLLADFLDGFVARALNVKSELGGQLDSLADMVTFGVLPGIMLFNIIQAKTNFITTIAASSPINLLEQPVALVGFVYTLFACLRLAKFNLDTRQTENFIGLNTPSGALFILGFYMQFFSDWSLQSNWDFTIYAKIAAIIIPFVLAFLMIAEFPMFSLKGNPFSWKQNKFRLMLILSVIPQILLLKWLGLSTIILTYIIFAFIQNVNKNKK